MANRVRLGRVFLSSIGIVGLIGWALVVAAAAPTASPEPAATVPPPTTLSSPPLTVAASAPAAPVPVPVPVPVAVAVPVYLQGVKATAGQLRGVIVGGMVSLELSRTPDITFDPIVTLIGMSSEAEGGSEASPVPTARQVEVYDIKEKAVIVRIPKDLPRGEYKVHVALAEPGRPTPSDPLIRPRMLNVESRSRIAAWALLPLVTVVTLITWILRKHRQGTGTRRLNAGQLMFLDARNQTYSLSRAQFIVWVAAITAAYVFIFLARGLVEDVWTFPSLKGFAITFLLSLATLVGAGVMDKVKPKGAGQAQPAVADLVVHGGVLALDRVQQLLWTVIAVGMFLWIIVKNYALTTQLPEVPDELLILMGISSAGYLTGKMVRDPGPILKQVIPTAGSVRLTLKGEYLSSNAFIWIDGAPNEGEAAVITRETDAPSRFARELQVTVKDVATLDQWLARPRTVTAVNADGQRAEWLSAPRIVKATVRGRAANTVNVEFETEYVGADASWEFTGASVAPGTKPERNPAVANAWTVSLAVAAGQEQPFQAVTLRAADGQSSSYTWSPTP